jgi:hypothetical protein
MARQKQQQQQSSSVQFGQSLGDLLALHSCGVQPQSAHFMIQKTRLSDKNLTIFYG